MAGALSQYANGLQGVAPIGIPDVNYYGAERYSNQPQTADYANTLNGLGKAFADKKSQEQQQAQALAAAQGGLGQMGNDFGATASDAQGGFGFALGGILGMLGPAGALANAMLGTSSVGSQAANGLLGMLGFGKGDAAAANEAASNNAAQAAVGEAMGGDHSGGQLSASDAAAATSANEAASNDAAASAAADAAANGAAASSDSSASSSDSGASNGGDAGNGGDGGGDGGGGYAKGGAVSNKNKCLITKASNGGAYEIKTLGDFKDKYMRDDPHLSHMADQIDDMAPSVIKHIDASKNPEATYKHIHIKFIAPASRAITRNEHSKALHLYADLLNYVTPMASR